MALDTDIDDQDQAETFDEEMTDGDGNGETSDPFDRGRGVLDETSRKGDADLDDDDEALDADEEDDETLDAIDGDADEDDLDDDDGDDGPLAVDAIPDFTSDRDFRGEPGEAEVSAAPDHDAETISMGDMADYSGASRVSDLESDALSDDDLKELDYLPAEPAKPAAAAPAPPSKAEARHEDKRLDEGLEETFPASDPVSAKHIT